MKKQIIFLKVAGWICIVFVVFHAAFYKLFHWDTNLVCLNNSDRAILLTYHLISILILSFMAIVSIFQAKDLLQSNLKYSVLSLFAIFYLIRIVAEFIYFGISPATPVILLMCGIPLVLFGIPVLYKNKE